MGQGVHALPCPVAARLCVYQNALAVRGDDFVQPHALQESARLHLARRRRNELQRLLALLAARALVLQPLALAFRESWIGLHVHTFSASRINSQSLSYATPGFYHKTQRLHATPANTLCAHHRAVA